jgi:hypothetical protein
VKQKFREDSITCAQGSHARQRAPGEPKAAQMGQRGVVERGKTGHAVHGREKMQTGKL